MQDEQDYFAQEQPRTMEVYDRETDARLGHVASISTESLTLLTPLEIEKGKRFPLRIGLNLDSGWTETIELDGEAVSDREAAGSGHRNVRIRFVEPSAEARSQLERLVASSDPQNPPDESLDGGRLL